MEHVSGVASNYLKTFLSRPRAADGDTIRKVAGMLKKADKVCGRNRHGLIVDERVQIDLVRIQNGAINHKRDLMIGIVDQRQGRNRPRAYPENCLLYTSDAADE